VRVAVLGLWHLGTVTAAGTAAAGHRVLGWDPDLANLQRLAQGEPPLFEPGLAEQLKKGIDCGLLSFEADLGKALDGAEIIWVTHDTPVDDQDRADPEVVLRDVRAAIPLSGKGALFLVSSQLPAGSVGGLAAFAKSIGRDDLEFACSPENLRLGQALKVFSDPDRLVCGVPSERAKGILSGFLSTIVERIEWMGVASAEMTKHAINAFLATSVSFANEIASVCERVGADAKEVERGLKTERRIGPGAYLGPGQAFAGGTLARDLAFLGELGAEHGLTLPVLRAAKLSNDLHKGWVEDALIERLGSLEGRKVALWGLAYKPGTDTLRRSSSLEIAGKLGRLGARVTAHDPQVKKLPQEWQGILSLCPTALSAVEKAHALVVATPWPEYLEIPLGEALGLMERPLLVDPSGFLRERLGSLPLEYLSIGYARGLGKDASGA
jgi:UDPglucose 6-dehydrogenase